jgi:hypothetical protein
MAKRSSFSEKRDVRYSFHGKMRFTGQPVDGFVEAPSSSDAIDRLADQGIIGVYTVRPDPLPQQNAILLSGPADPGAAMAGAASANPAGFSGLDLSPGPGAVVLTQLVDKLTTLVGQVEKILARPMAVYSGPVRGDGTAKAKRATGPNEAQNSALRAIFETNLDLRQSLAKLSSATAAVATTAATNAAHPAEKNVVVREPHGSRDARETSGMIPRPSISSHEPLEMIARSA